MLVIYKGRPLEIDWYVYRGCNRQTDDFDRLEPGDAWAFVVGYNNSWCIPVTVGHDAQNKQYIHLSIDSGTLKQGIYDMKLVWIKNTSSVSEAGTSMSVRNCVVLSGVFAVSNNYDDDNTGLPEGDTVVKVLRCNAESHGFDGLSAYEMSVFKGKTLLNEDEWLAATHGEGFTDYHGLVNKPKINGVELDGNKTPEQLGITFTVSGGTLKLKTSNN